MLQSWDHQLGVDGIAIVEALVREGEWIFAIMAPAYNYTLQIFFGGLIVVALIGDRAEAWRGAFCFVGTLLTTCIIAAFVPAKGLGMWAPDSLIAQLPEQAMRNFWPHFDEFYYGADPVLRLQVIDGAISFPSFHTVVGLLIVAMWRKNIYTCAIGAIFLVFMLLAIFPGGGHYFVDMLGGFAVWAAWFALSLGIERRHAQAATSSVNFARSMLPPETMHTTGPSPASPVSAAATASAPAPSAMVRDLSAIRRIASRVWSSVTVIVPSVTGRIRSHIRAVTLFPPAPSTNDAFQSGSHRGPPSRSDSA